MLVNEELKALINQAVSFQKIRESAKLNGMQTLYESALRKVEMGLTSLEEAFSVTLGAE